MMINKKLSEEILEMREKLYDYIDKAGISDDPELMYINKRLDELILQWFAENKQ